MAAERIWSRFLTVLIFGCATFVAWPAPQRATLDQLLLRVFERPPKLAYTAIQDRMLAFQPGSKRRYKLFVDANGTTISTLIDLQAGSVVVDDGKTTSDYNLGSKTLMVSQSFRKNDMSAKARANLAKKNYTFKVLLGENISGRRTEKLVASPKNTSLATRTYWFDRETKIMMRQVQDVPSGESYTTLDTIELNFSSPRPLVPTLTPAWNKITQPETTFTTTLKSALNLAGFSLKTPSSLPMGFTIQGYIIQTFGRSKLLTIILNDGFYRPILHVYRKDWGVEVSGGSLAGGAPFSMGKLQGELVSDLPSGVVTSIQRAFSKVNP